MFQALNKKKVAGRTPAAQNEKKRGANAEAAGGLRMQDELMQKSSYHAAIQKDVAQYGEALRQLGSEMAAFHASSAEELDKMYCKALAVLEQLSDDHAVLKHIETWPHSKWEMMIVATVRHKLLADFQNRITSWPPKPMPPYDEVEALEKQLDAIRAKVEDLLRQKSEDTAKFTAANVYFDWRAINRIQQQSVRFGHRYCTIALAAYDHHRKNAPAGAPVPMRVRTVLKSAANFSFLKVYQFAGGFDKHTKELFSRINQILQSFENKAEFKAKS